MQMTAGCSKIGEWPLGSFVVRKPGKLSLLSINKAKGLVSLAVIMIEYGDICGEGALGAKSSL
jgi:hypothetical protein